MVGEEEKKKEKEKEGEEKEGVKLVHTRFKLSVGLLPNYYPATHTNKPKMFRLAAKGGRKKR